MMLQASNKKQEEDRQMKAQRRKNVHFSSLQDGIYAQNTKQSVDKIVCKRIGPKRTHHFEPPS